MHRRTNAVYARQSVDKKDSISIESQIDFCRFELQGDPCKVYADRGYSGKNTDRPNFQRLMDDIQQGLIARVVVYKLDRISRSILDFSNMMELFTRYDVEFVSSTEKFDTSTPMGRAMLNICIVFAQLERVTIQNRITDAYYARGRKGFRMGGRPPYGFRAEPALIDGIHTKKLVAVPEEAETVRRMFALYARPEVSYGDIARTLAAEGVLFGGKELGRATLAQLLRNPVYVRADRAVYDFFKSQGAVISNDPAEFTGVQGCYLYQGRGAAGSKLSDLNGQLLVLAPHEGLVESAVWLQCRKKLMNNRQIQSARKATHTWLAGKIKCGRCGYALTSVTGRTGVQYLRCTKRLDNKSCPGCGKIRTAELEAQVAAAMGKHLEERLRRRQPDSRLQAIRRELAETELQISNLIDALAQSGPTLTAYVNSRIEELDGVRAGLERRLGELTVQLSPPETLTWARDRLRTWESVPFDERRQVADVLLLTVRATSEKVDIEWKV